MARMQRSLFAQLNALAEEIAGTAEKSAAAKKAEGCCPADPGGYQGASSHPTTSVDNNVQEASTGARAAEYEADIKKQQGEISVDSTPEMSQEGRQDEVQLNINTHTSAVGEDAAVEDDYKGDKDDPGTTHPATTEDGEKYSSVSFKEARDRCSTLGNDILASLINFGAPEKKAEMPAALKEHAEKKEDKGELKGDQHKLDVDNDGKIEGSDLAALREGKEAAYKAGYDLAAQLGVEKTAAEAAVREVCANTLREADEMADLFIGFYSENTKQAGEDPMEEAAEGESHEEGVGSGASDAAPPADMEAMMGGGEADLGAAPPSEDEAMQELAMALEELGIPPEALLEALEAEAGGAGVDPAAGEMPAGAGGELPPEAMMGGDPKMAAARELGSIGHAVINFRRAGKFQIKEARTKRSRQLRDMMKTHIRELTSR